MSTLAKLMVVLGLDAGGYSDGLTRAARDAEQASTRIGSVIDTGVALVGAGVSALTALGTASATAYTKYEQQLTEVFTLLPGITDQAMGAMSEDVKGFALDFGVLPEKEIPALYQALSSGVPADNVFSFLETSQKAAVAGNTELMTTVDGLTSVVNAYGAETISAAEASDKMFAAVVFGKTTFEELSSTLYNVNPIAASLGVNFGDVTSAIAAMTAQGIPTAQTTTMLRQMFVELGDSTSNVGKIFESVSGQSFKAFIASGGNVQDALKLLEVSAAKNNKGINELFSSVEAGSASLALTGKGTELFAGALEATANSAGATERAYTTMDATIAQSINKIKAAGSVFLITIGEKMAPAIAKILDVLVRLAQSDAAIKFIGALGDAMARGVDLIVAFGTAAANLAKMALGWGNNIGTSFADGIISAAQDVVSALQYMGSVIASWLMPGSPPKIVPQLDQWGADAATVYAKSWLKGDYSAFKEIGGLIEDALKGMVNTGAMSEGDLITTMLGSSASIARGVTELKTLGQVTDATFNQIVQSAGPAGAQVQNAVRAFFALRSATQALDTAQDRLTETTQRYSGILKPLNADMQKLQDREQQIRDMQRIADLNKQITSGALKGVDAELAENEIAQIKLRQRIDGIERERDTAVDAAKAKVNAAQATVNAAQDAYNQQQNVLDIQSDHNKLIGDQIKLLQQATKATKELTKKEEETPFEKQQKALEARQQQVQDLGRLHFLQKQLNSGELGAYETVIAQNEIEQIKLRLQEQGVDISNDDLAAAQDAFELEQKRLKELEKIQKVRGGAGGGGGIGAGGGMPALGDVQGPLDAINQTVDAVNGKIQTVKDTVIGLTDSVTQGAATASNALYTIFAPAIDSVLLLFTTLQAGAMAVWAIILGVINTYGTQIASSAQLTFGSLLTMISTIFSTVLTIVTTIVGTVVKFLQDNQKAIADIIGPIIVFVVQGIGKIADFITTNIKPILAGLTAVLLYIVVPAFIAWATAAYVTAAANIAALAPILLPLAAIGIAVALLYAAWESNFWGIRDILTDVWNNYLYPTFIVVRDWLATYLPIAVQALATFWNTILKPALVNVWTFITTSVIPLFKTMVAVHIASFKIAVQQLANFWTNILKPALLGVYNFITSSVVPLFKAVTNVYIAAFKLAVRLLSAAWTNVLLPALKDVWTFINTYITPIFTFLYQKVINEGLKPALQSVAFFILGTLIPQFMAVKANISGHLGPALETAQSALGGVKDAFGYIDSAIKSTISWIQAVADKLNSISVPSWLQGHSPPPMAHWFDYISDAMSGATSEADAFNAALGNDIGMPSGVTGSALSTAGNDRPNMTINIDRPADDPRTSRDELRMQAALWNMNVVG